MKKEEEFKMQLNLILRLLRNPLRHSGKGMSLLFDTLKSLKQELPEMQKYYFKKGGVNY